jgi:hypothetical protein
MPAARASGAKSPIAIAVAILLKTNFKIFLRGMAGRKIVGIDAGYVNFAVCGINTRDITRPYHWSNTALFTGKFSEERLVNAMQNWIRREDVQQLLNEADEIILERQMTMKFQAVNHWIRANFFAKTREVNPNTVGAFFSLPIKDRKQKKKQAVDLVTSHTVFPVRKGKKDDLADAYLLAFYGAIESEPLLQHQWEELQPNKKKRKTLDLA